MRRALVLAATLVLLPPQVALGWDPFAPDLDAGVTDPDPAPYAVPSGLYVVTDVYAGDVVTTAGATTTFSTTTVRDQPGTYARVVDTVTTNEASAYDGRSFNPRARLPDGRLVAGTYYEDFVLTSGGYVSVNIVFFQDDSVTALLRTPLATPVATQAATPAHPTLMPSALPVPTLAPATRTATPHPWPSAAPVAPAVSASAGIALAEHAQVVGSIEVLRGRLIHLWPRAFRDGVAVTVSAWRLVSGAVDVATPRSASGEGPCDVVWLVPTPPGATLTLRFEVTSDALPGRVMIATVAVVVRSPALLW